MCVLLQRLARAVTQEDSRLEPPVAQVVFYQPGIGSDENFYSRYVQGEGNMDSVQWF